MTQDEIKNRIIVLESELAAIQLQTAAIGFAGSIAGVFYANKQKKSFMGKVGFFILGGMIAGIPTTLIYSNKTAEKLAELKQLQSQVIE